MNIVATEIFCENGKSFLYMYVRPTYYTFFSFSSKDKKLNPNERGKSQINMNICPI